MSEARVRRWWVVAGLLVVGLGLVGCRRQEAVSPLDSMAERYLGLCVALGERDPDALDFYVGAAGPVAAMRRAPPKLAAIAAQAAGLRDEIASSEPGLRGEVERRRAEFLERQLDALRLRAEMLAGKTLTVDEESRVYFGVTTPEDTEAADRVRLRAELAKELGGAEGLAQRYSLFERGFVVPPARVPAVFEAALGQCRAATLRHVVLPAGEGVEVQYVSHKPWSGYSTYRGKGRSVIEINMDFPLTVDRLLDLACHEGYPGHHVFNTLREQAMVERAHAPEWEAQLTFSPQSFVSEGAASYAGAMAFSPEERLRVERDVLFPLAGLEGRDVARYLTVERLVEQLESAEPGIAREYLDGRLEYERAAEAFERETLMEQPDALLLYLNEYRSYMLTYTVGRRMVERGVERGGASVEERWRRYEALMVGPVDSLAGFAGR
jgi:hypothetical protein